MAVSLRQLTEKRGRIAAEMRAIVDAAGAADDSEAGLTAEQQAAFDALKAALADLETAIANRAAVDDAERRIAGVHVAGGDGGDTHWQREARAFSVVRAIAAAAGLPGVDAGREREISAELARRTGRQAQGVLIPNEALMLERRVVTTTTPAGAPGGNIIGTFLDGAQFIDPLRSALVIRQLGARVLDGLVSNLDIPRLAQTSAGGWFAENTPMPTSDPGFDRVGLRPKHAGGIVELSRNVLIQSSPAVEDIVRADLAAVLARVIDAAAIAGTGAAQDPVGLLHYTGVPVVTPSVPGGITWDLVNALIGTVSANNASEDGRGFLTSALVRAQAAVTPKIASAAQGFVADDPHTLAGYPLLVSSLVPGNLGTDHDLTAVMFGVWSDCLIGVWGDGIELLVNPYAEAPFSKGNVLVRAVVTCDIEFRHPGSFAIATVAAPALVP